MELNENSHIVTCVDILGYKEILRRDNQEEIDEIETEFEYFVQQNAILESNFPGFRCISYTDNFLFFYKLDYSSDTRKRHDTIREIYGDAIKEQNERIERVLFLHIYSLALTQFDLISNNYFIRGGLTIGGFREQNATVSGSGLLEAHDLEEKAIYPRIILNPDVVENYITQSRPIPLLIDSEDKNIFIDFLGAVMMERLKSVYGNVKKGEVNVAKLNFFKSELLDVRKNIENALLSATSDRVLAKYKWLVEYFDFFCYSHESIGLNELAIEPLNKSNRFISVKRET